MLNRVGQQLGNYRLIRLLGQGGFAEVYLGKHIHLDTEAAIKVLQTQIERSQVKQFRLEARTIARLEHPNIVRVLDFGVEGNTPFLVMSYAPNGNLRTRHPKGSRLPLDVVISYVRQIAPALQYAHEQKLIHRDIKPENLLVGRANEILLSDFGLALTIQSSRYQSAQDIAGTFAYTAPEQLQGRPRAASDQYALGIVVYEWLCGQRPFQGSPIELMGQHALKSPPLLSQYLPSLPPDVEEVVLKALAKEPQDRFPNVMAFAAALTQASQVAPGSCETTYSTELLISSEMVSTKRSISRRRVTVGLAGVVAVGAAISGLLWLTRSHQPAISLSTPTPVPRTSTPTSPLPSVGTTLYTYRGHVSWVNTLAWSPDGKRIASSGADSTVQIWDATNGGNIFIYRGFPDYVKVLAWSPNGRRIACGGQAKDNTIQVWDAADGRNVYIYRGHSSFIWGLAWSPNSQRIASASPDNTVQIWDEANGGHVFIYQGHFSWVNAVAWSPDGQRIASGGADKTVQVWNAADGRNIYTYHGHSDAVISVAWSPDGKRIVSGGHDNIVQVWDAADGGHAYTYHGHSDYVNVVAWSPDGKRIASGSGDSTVQVWNAADGSNVYTYRKHSDAVWWLAWSPDGSRIASGGKDNTVQVWQAK